MLIAKAFIKPDISDASKTQVAHDCSLFSSMLSSLLIVSKTGVEKLLTFGEVDRLEAPLLKKLVTIAKFLPVFVFTSIFRIVGTAFIFYSDLVIGPLIIASVLFLPFIVLSGSKWCCLEDLSLAELLKGVVGELGTITVWGRLLCSGAS